MGKVFNPERWSPVNVWQPFECTFVTYTVEPPRSGQSRANSVRISEISGFQNFCWMVRALVCQADGRVFESNQWLSFDFQILSYIYSGLKSEFLLCVQVFGLHTPEPTHQWPRSGPPQVSLLAVDWTMDVVGEGQCPSPYACVPQSSVLNAATLAVVIV